MVTTELNLIETEIEDHIKSCDEEYYLGFFIGTTSEPTARLFSFHKVDEESDCWYFKKLSSKENAELLKKKFITKGMDGEQEKDETGEFIYCYMISNSTFQPSRNNLGFFSLMC